MSALRMAGMALLLAIVAAGWWQARQIGALRNQNAALTHDLASYRATVVMMQRSAQIHAAYVAEQATAADAQAVLDRNLKALEDRNAPLSDHLRRAAGILWP